MEQLKNAFMASEKLKRHIDFLFAKGGMYKCCNNNLLLHGCIPMNKDGSFMEFDTGNCVLSGKALLDELEKIVRQGHSAPENSHERQKGNTICGISGAENIHRFSAEKRCVRLSVSLLTIPKLTRKHATITTRSITMKTPA